MCQLQKQHWSSTLSVYLPFADSIGYNRQGMLKLKLKPKTIRVHFAGMVQDVTVEATVDVRHVLLEAAKSFNIPKDKAYEYSLGIVADERSTIHIYATKELKTKIKWLEEDKKIGTYNIGKTVKNSVQELILLRKL
jgi:hypothetical protein